MQTELLNGGKPPQNGIKISYSCLPEAGKEKVLLLCSSVHWLSGFWIKPNFTESLWFLEIFFFFSSPELGSMKLTDPFFFLETSSLAFSAICTPAVPSVLLWLLFPWVGRAEAQLSKGRTSFLPCFCTGFSEHVKLGSRAITQPSFAAQPQNIPNGLFAVLGWCTERKPIRFFSLSQTVTLQEGHSILVHFEFQKEGIGRS